MEALFTQKVLLNIKAVMRILGSGVDDEINSWLDRDLEGAAAASIAEVAN